ncbi:unnamed protein product [Rotaria socialis]|uniref:Uncharacterized protein n=1 Tax=Rotaria socialis TaxID=392032 RepID=A0A821A0I1_9BILA|nr:unnamed protein product [Rotaria socialis]
MNFITKQVKNKLGVDLNGDGVIGSVESATHMDINGDGTVGGKPAHPSNSNYYGSVGYATNPHQSSDGGLMNKLENVTHMDLNSDGP